MIGPLPKQIRALKPDGSQAPVGHVMKVNAKGVFEADEVAGGAFTGDTIELAVTKVHDFSDDAVNNVQPLFPWGTAPVKLTDPSPLPAGDNIVGHSISWSPNGEFLCRAHDNSPFVTIYQRSGDVFNKVPNPGTLPGNNANATAWSPDGEFIATGGAGAYYNVVYTCYNGAGNWYYTKNVVGSGGSIEVAETNGSGSSTLVFYFRATSGAQGYTPRVMMKGTPYALVTF